MYGALLTSAAGRDRCAGSCYARVASSRLSRAWRLRDANDGESERLAAWPARLRQRWLKPAVRDRGASVNSATAAASDSQLDAKIPRHPLVAVALSVQTSLRV
ncbi:hypothetical protein ON010_g11674 [Phytophthora cinnamomi]|nr:hypothetical protein ON010_g11674 [Phytophthora cinnamomi]